ncbi:MAG: penicillin-binding protein 1C [Bacteroidia bacterium]|nr:penicillin-binding protein 1C [Bacteroidia bacterium]
MRNFFRNTGRWIWKWKYPILVIGLIFSFWFYHCLPERLFTSPTCTILLDREGNLLSAKIADDGQWRFPENPEVPVKFRECIIRFEDRNFFDHPGISLRSLGRAARQNISAGRIVSGGSTLTMQLARIVRGNRSRNLWEKGVEMLWALRMEMRYSKEEILAMYVSHAPFGGNVVGLDAAAWRYFGRKAEHLSWAEAATLAVLPNSPGLIYPGKNQDKLWKKRNRLLKGLLDAKIIDSTGYELAIAEPLPQKPFPLPKYAPHLLQKAIADGQKGKVIRTTVDVVLQQRVLELVDRHHRTLMLNDINNAAVIVISVEKGEVVAYVGNTEDGTGEHGTDVDIITSPRSTGSILKPFLYAEMLQDGKLMPKMIVPDVPTNIGGYSPKNFNAGYDGAISADKALSRSLNIPAVRMLSDYGPEKFQRRLQHLGMTTLHRSPDEYGLSLILGGAEASLWDLVTIYAGMARTLKQYPVYQPGVWAENVYVTGQVKNKETKPLLDPAVIYTTFDAMVEVNRPEADLNWKAFSSSSKVAWKTGTSFGFRDGWAVGITPGYVVGVWVGNADGEGRPGITGIQAAAPLLFDVFSGLPRHGWFRKPERNMDKVRICRQSGHRASEYCETVDYAEVPRTCLRTTACPYHQLIHLDRTGRYRADSECEDVDKMKHKVFFVLPPLMEKYYKYKHPSYETLPRFLPTCVSRQQENNMYVVYPKKGSRIKVPVTQDGSLGRTVFEVVHRRSDAVVHWHLDDQFLGSTREFHQMEIAPGPGSHIITLVDDYGVTVSQEFEVEE